MIYPNFQEVAESGYLTIAADTLSRSAAVEIELEDKHRRLILNLEIQPVDLMRALMGRGAVLCRFVVTVSSPALVNKPNEDAQ